MMKNNRSGKWKYLLCLLAVLGLLLVGCNNSQPDETTAKTTQAADVPHEYCLVLPSTATAQLTDAANALAEAIAQKSDSTPQVIKENKLTDEKRADTNTHWLLVGMTNFPQSAQVYESLPYGAQTITSVDGMLVIGGWYDEATVAALNSCRKQISSWIVEGELLIPEKYEKTVELNEILSALPQFSDSRPYDVSDCGDDCMMMIFKATETAYDAYLTALPDHGFDFYAENTIANIRFSTHEDEKYVIHTMCFTATGETRLMIEPLSKTALAPLPASDKAPDGSATLTQIGLNLSGGEEDCAGMSYLFQLEDGSFLVIDGGYRRDVDARRLYDCMREQAGDGNPITIAAWILTHGHGDHTGCFMRFSELYGDKVKVERFIYNDPCAAQRNLTGDGPYYQTNRLTMQKYPEAVIHKAHPGQKYAIRNAVIEIYYTLEMYAPAALTYYNACSIVFSVEVGGQICMFLGDISEQVSPLIASWYRESLACDLLQVAHHGFAGGTAILYQYLDPKYLLWPSADFVYTTRISADRFQTLDDAVKKENCFIAGNRVIRLLLDTKQDIVLLKREEYS